MKYVSRFCRIALSAALVTLSSCAIQKPEPVVAVSRTADVAASEGMDELDDYGDAEIADPFEKLNRTTFKMNDRIYRSVLRPISKVYTTIAPKKVRKSIDNVFDNLRFPARFVNSGLQGKFKRAGQEVHKFGVNSVLGVGGLFKVSDHVPSLVDIPEEDTGQTLAVWGVRNGAYLVAPVFGPSTVRDAVGLAGDYALNPINWGFALKGSFKDYLWFAPSANTIRLLPSQLDLYDQAKANSVDPYLAVRSIYLQNRKALKER